MGDDHEKDSEAHQIFRSVHGHSTTQDSESAGTSLPGITTPASTGVVYCSDRASANGFTYEDTEWANFGQGAPETGELEGASPRPTGIDFTEYGPGIHEYAPTAGTKELRQAVADLINEEHRQGKESKYTWENVCIVPGGRAGLTRIAAIIGDVLVSYMIPEYTAYDQMLSVFRRLVPIPAVLHSEDKYSLNVDTLEKSIRAMGISVVVTSNPKNPTGQAVDGESLNQLVGLSRKGTTIICDEFYSWYAYDGELGATTSAAKYIEDVNEDATVIVDGLTKNWRLPGWRVCWVVGPKSMIHGLAQAGSFLDGGTPHPLQCAALPLLEPKRCLQDRIALQKHFKAKRDYVLDRLQKMGFKVDNPPTHTFYVWLDLSCLPKPLDSGLVFFEELLKEKVIVVPGLFFDINPNHRRNLFDSPAHHFVRLSFGPHMSQLEKGLDGMERLLKNARDHVDEHGHLEKLAGGYVPHDNASTNDGHV